MKHAILALCLVLGGCATIFPSAATYQPVIVETTDAAQQAKDFSTCHKVADNYRPGVSVGSIAQSTVTGATNNAAYGVINPLVPVAGAAGGAASAAITGLGVTGQGSIKILVICLREKSHRDHAFIISDPNE